MNEPMKKKPSKLKTILIVLGVLFAIGIIGNLGDDKSNTDSNTNSTPTTTADVASDSDAQEVQTEKPTIAPTTAPTSTPIPEPTTEAYETSFSAGYYVAGVDFPAGKYDLVAENGSGNVSSSNMYDGGLNEIIGTEDDGFSIPSFNNAKLEDGVVLSVGGDLVLNIKSESAAVSEMQPRTNDLKEKVELSNGIYAAGADFPSGVYDIIAIDGSGNVSSSNIYDGGINEIMGTDNDGYSIKEFKHASLEDGVELDISGVTIELVPSVAE